MHSDASIVPWVVLNSINPVYRRLLQKHDHKEDINTVPLNSTIALLNAVMDSRSRGLLAHPITKPSFGSEKHHLGDHTIYFFSPERLSTS